MEDALEATLALYEIAVSIPNVFETWTRVNGTSSNR